MNDPNGPVIYKKEIHLFYQHHPFSEKWGDIHWGHIKSKDLIHWEHLPIAFGPSFEKGEDHCYSGCCIIGTEGRATSLYTSIGKRFPEHGIAIASEDMVTWEKYEGNPVIEADHHEESGVLISNWRDPYAWKGVDGQYYCVIGGQKVDEKLPEDMVGMNPTVHLYSSPDLREWNYLGPMVSRFIDGKDCSAAKQVNVGNNWECPNFFKFVGNEKWVLFISPHDPVAYAVGDFKNNTFTPNEWQTLDWGAFYAPNSFIDLKGRNIMVGWMRMNLYDTWNGCFSLPRHITLNEDGKTVTALPIPEIKELREKYYKINGFTMPEGKSMGLLPIDTSLPIMEFLNEKSVEMLIKITPDTSSKKLPGFILELYKNLYNPFIGTLGYDNEDNLFYFADKSGPFELHEDETELEIRIYVDRTIVEVFLNDRFAISHAVQLKNDTVLDCKFLSEINDTIVNSIEIWGMKSINLGLRNKDY